MRIAGFARGLSAAGVLLLACSAGAAQARTAEAARSFAGERVGAISLETVAGELRGDWEGQIEVRAADGSLSIAPASMCAKPQSGGNPLEVYYEGFAFGNSVEGAMLLSHGEENPGATFRDSSAQIRGSCSPNSEPEASDPNSLHLNGRTEGKGREIRASFTRHSADSWSIQYQAKDQSGQWAPIVTLHMDRMDKGQRSAAADGFDTAGILAALRESSATASVDTDD